MTRQAGVFTSAVCPSHRAGHWLAGPGEESSAAQPGQRQPVRARGAQAISGGQTDTQAELLLPEWASLRSHSQHKIEPFDAAKILLFSHISGCVQPIFEPSAHARPSLITHR